MRFIFKCIVTLAILYRAILVSQGGTETAALSSELAEAASAAQARARDEITARVGAFCRSDPATCLDDASRLSGLVASEGAGGPVEARHPRHGAIAAATR